MNRLAAETSPYLRQHADNPVHWQPWGEDALAEARDSDRPILLSVGYSACHWCHVMEHESFSDPGVAELMNSWFVNVKVDREERPDVDAVYMRAVQALTGRGGWPMTVFLTPDGSPFFGGTYYPPEPRHGMASFRQVLEGVQRAWMERRESVDKAAGELRAVLERAATGEPMEAESSPDAAAGALDIEERAEASEAAVEGLLNEAVRSLLLRYDTVRGGLGPAPKFPQPVVWDFLLTLGFLRGDPQIMESATATLREMARGGMRDHLGGGFHRYSVDERWLVPHFEKMLYDNALLLRLYVDGWRYTGDDELRTVATEIADDLLRDFQLEAGGFAAAWDADSEGVEGKFYVWTPAELREALGPDAARRFARRYDVTESGNFEGSSILHPVESIEEIARDEEMSPEALHAELEEARATLRSLRSERIPPLRDEKVVTSWNGMTIRALAAAGATFDEPRWIEAAARAADFLLDRHRTADGLLRATMEGEGGISAFLEDWAALGNALLTLHEATLEPRWLAIAIECGEELLDRFDGPGGLLWDAEDTGGLPVRPRDLTDSATPSGNALAVELLLRLAAILGRRDLGDRATAILDRERSDAARFPAGYGRLLSQQLRLREAPTEILVAGPRDDPATRALLAEVWRRRPPFAVVAGLDASAPADDALGLEDAPLFHERGTVDGRPAVWVCRGFTCRAPVTDVSELSRELADEAARD